LGAAASAPSSAVHQARLGTTAARSRSRCATISRPFRSCPWLGMKISPATVTADALRTSM
jgi:hypothetical protein